MADDDIELSWEKLSSEQGPDLGLMQARFDTLRHPSGDPTVKRLVLESQDWVNCVALTEEGEIVMVEQYRFGTGAVTLEPAGGLVDPGESPEQAARRELREETGYGGGEWTYMGAVEVNPAIHPHLCHHYLARDVTLEGPPEPGPNELVAVRLVEFEEIKRAMRDGRLRHSLALSALSRTFDLFELAGGGGPAPWACLGEPVG